MRQAARREDSERGSVKVSFELDSTVFWVLLVVVAVVWWAEWLRYSLMRCRVGGESETVEIVENLR